MLQLVGRPISDSCSVEKLRTPIVLVTEENEGKKGVIKWCTQCMGVQ